MKVSKTHFYNVLFIIVIFLQLYLDSFKTNIFIQIGLLGVYFFYEKLAFNKAFINKIKPVFVLFGLGFLGTLIHSYTVYDIIKDIVHFLKPILGLFIGYLFFKKINNFKLFAKTIVLCGFASALIHFSILIFTYNLFSGSINALREFGKDNFLELFALFILFNYKKFQNESLFIKNRNATIIAVVLLISNILYFSRTMIVVAILLTLSVAGYTVLSKKAVRLISLIIIIVLSFFMYLNTVKIDRNKSGIEAFLYKIKIAPEEILKTKIDKEDHKDLWDHWRGYEAMRAFDLMKKNPSSFVIGTGFGSVIDLKFKAPLTGEKEGIQYISELHNGYMYVFYKTGIFGLIIQLIFFVMLYLTIYHERNRNKFIIVLISGIGLVYGFTSLTITGIYNGRDVIIFILGALLFFDKEFIFKNDDN